MTSLQLNESLIHPSAQKLKVVHYLHPVLTERGLEVFVRSSQWTSSPLPPHCQLPNWGCGLRWTRRSSLCACWLAALSRQTSPWAKYPSVWQNAKSPRVHRALLPHLLPFITTSISSVAAIGVFSSPHTPRPASNARLKHCPPSTVLLTWLCWNPAFPASLSLSLGLSHHHLQLTHTQRCGSFDVPTSPLYESPMVFVWRAKNPFLILSEIR